MSAGARFRLTACCSNAPLSHAARARRCAVRIAGFPVCPRRGGGDTATASMGGAGGRSCPTGAWQNQQLLRPRLPCSFLFAVRVFRVRRRPVPDVKEWLSRLHRPGVLQLRGLPGRSAHGCYTGRSVLAGYISRYANKRCRKRLPRRPVVQALPGGQGLGAARKDVHGLSRGEQPQRGSERVRALRRRHAQHPRGRGIVHRVRHGQVQRAGGPLNRVHALPGGDVPNPSGPEQLHRLLRRGQVRHERSRRQRWPNTSHVRALPVRVAPARRGPERVRGLRHRHVPRPGGGPKPPVQALPGGPSRFCRALWFSLNARTFFFSQLRRGLEMLTLAYIASVCLANRGGPRK